MSQGSRFYKDVLDEMFDGVYFVDTERRITYWNKGAERITGFEQEVVLGRSCSDNILVHVDSCGNQLCENGCPLTQVVGGGCVGTLEIFLRHRDGHRVPVMVRAAPMHDDAGNIVGAIEIFSDNTSKVTAVDQIHELEQTAFIDPLTGLPNRRLGESFLAAREDEQRRNGGPYGVIMLDLDFFKRVNDTRGHQAGDEALKTVARSISGGIRAGDLACRWGGEEFLVVLANPSPEQLLQTAERLCTLVRSSTIAAAGATFQVTASLGATLSAPGIPGDDVLGRADELLYASKSAGRNRVTCDSAPARANDFRAAS